MDLLPLALQAFDDHTAQPVLGDAVLETGWYDPRVMPVALNNVSRRRWLESFTGAERTRNLFLRRAAKPDRKWCRAVAAVLLFGEWSAGTWPGVASSWSEPPVMLWTDIVRRMYSNAGISEVMYETPTLFGLNRTVDPQRLAGMAIEASTDVRARIREVAERLEITQRSFVAAEPDNHAIVTVTVSRPAPGGLPAPGSLRVFKRR